MMRLWAGIGRGPPWLLRVPESRRERMRGLLGSPPPRPREGLLLLGTRSIHTFGMRSPIAVALLDHELRVVRVLRVPPRRVLLPRRGIRHALECSVANELREGDVLWIRGPAQPNRSRRAQ